MPFRFLSAGLLICVSASAERLRSPWEASRITPTEAPYTCPAPPAFRRVLDLQGYYTDKQYSVIDPKRLAAVQRSTSPLETRLSPALFFCLPNQKIYRRRDHY